MSSIHSSHFDATDDYVAACGRGAWANSKSVELAERANRLARAGKANGFTLRLRSFIIHAQCHSKHDVLSALMCAWGRYGPFYDDSVKAEVKKIMGE